MRCQANGCTAEEVAAGLCMGHTVIEVERAIRAASWESAAAPEAMAHFTGRGNGWTIQLVTLHQPPRGDRPAASRMGAATKGTVVLKLTDELAELAERCGRAALASKEPL